MADSRQAREHGPRRLLTEVRGEGREHDAIVVALDRTERKIAVRVGGDVVLVAREEGASHLGGHAGKAVRPAPAGAADPIEIPAERAEVPAAASPAAQDNGEGPLAAIPATWAPDAEKELRKIPFFVRGKARRNTEAYALDKRVPVITVETLYDAKAHFSR